LVGAVASKRHRSDPGAAQAGEKYHVRIPFW
jgi:hypothetical protein